MDKYKEFVLKLEQLTRETGIAIGGCGCCGSPYLFEAEEPGDPKSGYAMSVNTQDYVRWVEGKNAKDYDDRDKIIRKESE